MLRGFRNLADVDLAPGPRFNVLSGDNGQGKSNLLEAIYYLGALESFRLAAKDALIAHDAARALLAAKLAGGVAPRTAKIWLDRAAPRRLALDDKRPRTRADWLAATPMVLFHPGDLALASGPPSGRRALLDHVAARLAPEYARALADYETALKSRNRLLRQEHADRRSITSYDPLLAAHGAVLGLARAALVEELEPATREAFARIAGEELPLEVRYQPRVPPREDALRTALARSLDKDLARGFTAEGPHADDLALTVRERRARHHASQGQHRMIVLALKAAELTVLARRLGLVPILLLDDVSSELDPTRNARLMGLLDELGAQVFVTTTQPELIRVAHDRADYRVVAGRVEAQAP